MITLTLLAFAAAPAANDRVDLVPVERIADTELGDAPIRLWLNNSRQFREGDKARVQVETQHDGYLVVFNYDTEGRIRVIFPIDPADDNFIRGGRRYEIQGRGDRESFLVYGDGTGLVYAAISTDPFRFDGLEAGGNWDYTRIAITNSSDPEADVTEFLESIASDRGFDYDVVQYRVYSLDRRYIVTNAWYPYWDDYYCHPFYRPSLFGCRPYGSWYVGVGYNPYRYGGYYGYPYGYRYPWYYGGGVVRRNYPVVAGRPRSYTVVRRNPGTSTRVGGGRGAVGGSRPVSPRPRSVSRPRPESRPSSDRPAANPSTGGRPRQPDAARPRARRSPPASEVRPNVERDRPSGRPAVQISDGGPARTFTPSGGGRRVTPRSNDEGTRVERPVSRPDAPRSVERPRSSAGRPRAEGRPSESSRAQPRERAPRSQPAARPSPPPRSEPRSSPPPRAESPRPSPPPAASPSRSGSSSGGSPRRPRGN